MLLFRDVLSGYRKSSEGTIANGIRGEIMSSAKKFGADTLFPKDVKMNGK
jgi:hypothetical protein